MSGAVKLSFRANTFSTTAMCISMTTIKCKMGTGHTVINLNRVHKDKIQYLESTSFSPLSIGDHLLQYGAPGFGSIKS